MVRVFELDGSSTNKSTVCSLPKPKAQLVAPHTFDRGRLVRGSRGEPIYRLTSFTRQWRVYTQSVGNAECPKPSPAHARARG